MLKAPALRPGDRVAIVAPSGPFEREPFERGLAVIEGLGLRPMVDEQLFRRERYLAGSDAERLLALHEAMEGAEARAIWCARGGYGAARLLPALRLRPFVERPKLFVGFSDATALHAALNARGLATLHAPVVTQLAAQPPSVVERLGRLLFDPAPPPPLEGAHSLCPGAARGVLLGGNLAVLASLVGTPHLPSFAGAILFLEDVGERPYRIDRMWTQLWQSGALSRLRGLAVGELTRCEEKEADYTARDVMASLARELGIPSAIGFPVGHGDVNQPLPLGGEAALDADRGTLSFLESAVS
ncbi:MAG: S66 peptidase family protein [Deltaproteobacteria bacterium]